MPSKKVNSGLAMFEAAGRAVATRRPAARLSTDGPTAEEVAIIDDHASVSARAWVSYADPEWDEPETDEVEALGEGTECPWRYAHGDICAARGAYTADDPDVEAREEARADRFWGHFVRSVKRQARALRAAERKKTGRRR